MFGYIRPCKPQMKICEYDMYRAIYCGLCKELSHFGFVSRFTLSYDFAFLTALGIAINETDVKVTRQTCMAHLLKKSYCLEHCNELTYSAAMMCISVYHKLRDDKSDEKFAKKIAAAGLIPAIKKAYKKAEKMYPDIAKTVGECIDEQSRIESENCTSIDRAAEPSAQITSAMLAGLSNDETTQRILSRMGYLLGRYVYITDALDDAESDFKNKSYNALLLQDGCENCNMENIRAIAKYSVNLTLGELANAYVLLDVKKLKPIIDNIIYLGLGVTFDRIFRGESTGKKLDENEQSFERN